MAIYASFEHNGKISEHYIRILWLSKLVGTHLKAANIFNLLLGLKSKKYLLINCRFFMMDNQCKFWGEERIEKIATTCPSCSCLDWLWQSQSRTLLCLKQNLTSFHQSQMLMPHCFHYGNSFTTYL